MLVAIDRGRAMKPHVICLGSAILDSIYRVDRIPGTGIKLLPQDARQLASGMATSAAISIARLGGSVALWARVGDDVVGQQFIAQLKAESVSTEHVHCLKGHKTPFAAILVDPQGERLAVPFYDKDFPTLADWLPLSAVSSAQAVMCDVRWPAGAKALMCAAKKYGVPSVLDADTAPNEVLHELCTLADHVLFSEAALHQLLGLTDSRAALLQAAEKLTGAQVVGVTLGAKGALIRQQTDMSGITQYFHGHSVKVKDTLNAGDIWHGAYTYALACGKALAERVRWANMAAAMKCEQSWGWSGAPTRSQLISRLEKLS
jgi:sulfofructose kinase